MEEINRQEDIEMKSLAIIQSMKQELKVNPSQEICFAVIHFEAFYWRIKNHFKGCKNAITDL